MKNIIGSLFALLIGGGGLYKSIPFLGNTVGNIMHTKIAIGQSVPFVVCAVFVPCAMAMIFIWFLYKKHDVADTVKNGTGLYTKFRWLAVVASLISSVLITLVIGYMLNYDMLFMALISFIFAFTSFFWFRVFTGFGQQCFSQGSLEYWPK